MHAEVIAIGDELTSGQRLDSNSQWLSQRLGEIGIPVRYHTTVSDHLEAGVEVFRTAAARAHVVIATGGLGPTADDLTRPAIAAAAGCELQLNEQALAHIQGLFAKRKRPMPERNRSQAMFPIGSQMIHNPHGSAPGIDITIRSDKHSSRIFALPGVPAEMREMWEQAVAPSLLTMIGSKRHVIRHRCIKCFGVGESDLEQMLPDLVKRGREPAVGITVHRATITLRVTARAESPEACQAAIEPTEATIRQCLGDLVFGEEDDQLEHAVSRLLSANSQTLATVEWATEGVIARWLRALPDSASFYRGGVVVTGDDCLDNLFDISGADVREHGRNSRRIVGEMASRTRERFDADFGLAVSALPERDDHDRIYIGLATPTELIVKHRTHAGHPDILVERAAKQALDIVRKRLMEGRKAEGGRGSQWMERGKADGGRGSP